MVAQQQHWNAGFLWTWNCLIPVPKIPENEGKFKTSSIFRICFRILSNCGRIIRFRLQKISAWRDSRSGKEPQVPLRLVPSLQSLSRQATAKKSILFLQKLINLTKYQQKRFPKKTHQLNIGYFCLCPVKLEDLFHFLPASQPFSAHVFVFSFTFRLGRFEMSQESLDSYRTKGKGLDSNESVRKNVMTWIFPSTQERQSFFEESKLVFSHLSLCLSNQTVFSLKVWSLKCYGYLKIPEKS